MKYYDAQAEERRLRPLYDAIDSRNYKSALKIADTLLKKHAGNEITKVLKAITFERMGRSAEAFETVEEVRRETPTDEHTLSTMTLVYKALGKFEELTLAYETASKAEPEDSELLRGLFGALVRKYDYVKQQQVAMKLFKLESDEKFMLWAATCAFLQAQESTEPKTKTQFLNLAATIVARRVPVEGGLATEEAVTFYLDILQAQGKHAEVLEVLEGPLGERIPIESDRSRRKGRVYGELELLDYWTKLGHTISCAVDLRHYARILAEASPEAALQLVSEMDAAWVGAAADAAVQLEPLRRRVAALCLEFCIAEQLKRTETVPETLERCRALMALYTAASKLYEGADPRERGPADELPLLAAQYLTVAQRHFEPGSARLLIQAQLYVAVGLEHSKFNSDLRLATCSLYSLMGASTAALAIFKQLDLTTDGNSMVLLVFKVLMSQMEMAAALASEVLVSEVVMPAARASEVLVSQVVMPAARASEGRYSAAKAEYHAILTKCPDDWDAFKGAFDAMIPQSTAEPYSPPAASSQDPVAEDPSAALEAAARLVKEFQEAARASDKWKRIRGPDLALVELARRRVVLAQRGVEPLAAAARASEVLVSQVVMPAARASEVLVSQVKHIQLDTMPQHILPTLLGCGDWEQALDLSRAMEHMHRSHSRDAADSLLLAYNHGTYTKVPEFVGFKERLHSSHLRAVARTEVEMMNLRKAFIQTGEPADMLEVLAGSCHALPQGDFTKDRMEQLQFNEDLSTHTTWHSPFPSSPMTGLCDWWNGILGAAPSAADPHWMQGDRAARFLIPHLLRAAYSLSAPTADKPLLLEEIATNLRVLSTSLNATLGESSGSSGTAGVLAPRGDPVLARTFTLVRDFASLGVGGADGAAIAAGGTNFEAVTSGLKLLQTEVLEKSCEQTISDAGREEKPAGGLPISQGAVAAIGAFLAEPLLCVSMCLQAWTRQLAKSEKRKKKSSSPSAEQTAELKAAVQSLAAALGSSIQSLQANCEAAVSETKPEQMQILLAASGIQIPAGDMMAPEIVDGVLDGIVTGIQTSLKSVSVKLKRLQAVTAASVM
eukprot:gene1787-2453_t